VLIIGTFSIKGEKLFSQGETRTHSQRPALQPASTMTPRPHAAAMAPFRPAGKVARSDSNSNYAHPEPTYHNLALKSKSVREAEYTDPPHNA
jgi:hypothetical protein